MLSIGVTGGIGSGKSTVCQIFSLLNVPIYVSDIRAQQLMISDSRIISELKAQFGDDVYLANHSLNKAKLSQLVFENPNTRTTINSIVHPHVKEDFLHWRSNYTAQPYVIQESALLFETGNWLLMDGIITTICPLDERLERIMKRDTCSQETALQKINSQLDDKFKIEHSLHTINTGINNQILAQVLNIHQQLIQKDNENK